LLEQGTPITGASARVVGNSFIFAVSETADQEGAGAQELLDHDFIDLAIIYGTGQRAIITFEKDAAAARLFSDVFHAWRRLDRELGPIAGSGS
jgi:hypothetical protein